jgi:hypothetical protein
MLETRNSVSAKIRHRVDLFGKQLVGDGEYREQRRNGIPAIRLELKIQIGDSTSSLLQVCDGRYCWTYRKLFAKESLSRIDAVRAVAALAQAEKPAENAAENGPRPAGMLPGLGGLPRLLRGLNANFQFTSAQRGQWGTQPVWRLEGGWRPALLARILPKQKEAIEQGQPVDLSRLPEQLPDRVVLYLGQDDLFPYRIEYCRTAGKKDGDTEGEATRDLVTVELYEVHMNIPLDPGQFIYSPGSVEFSDQTDAFLQAVGGKK